MDDADGTADNPLPYYNTLLEVLGSEIGRLFASMDAEIRDNTIVIFICDNGSPNQVTRPITAIMVPKERSMGTEFMFHLPSPDLKLLRIAGTSLLPP
jgi:arylsulfatase A-like enzyme